MKKQSGFTITELMVGLTLAMILAFAVGTVYTQTRQSFRLQTAQTRITEQGRYAIAVFNKMATQAGYRNKDKMQLDLSNVFKDASGPVSVIQEDASGVLSFRFTSNTASEPLVIIKCDGTDASAASAPAAGYYTNTLSKSGNKLVCNNGTSDTDLLSDNVVDFKVTYGVDSSNPVDQVPDNYYAQASVAANWSKVYSAHLCIVLRGDMVSGNTQDLRQTYIDCSDTSVTAADKRIYRRFDSTVSLRNRFD